MDIESVFTVDRFRVLRAKPQERFRTFPESMSYTEDGTGRSTYPAIVAACGHDRLFVQDELQMDITAILRFGRGRVLLQECTKIPGNSSKSSGIRKKIAESEPSWCEMSGKTHVSGAQSAPEWDQNVPKTSIIDIHSFAPFAARQYSANQDATSQIKGLRAKLSQRYGMEFPAIEEPK